eukprot:TRINITY_DN20009_c0_g1_i1.p3 TRINITY_DN20009_c0_g1~~TRINITY_DN20009_c0_g1_i1.p3  ORF type:complete len:204 (-),score=61.77 TRINITY_DN20009_c0_g1_i1:72-608(-)
MQFVQNTFVQDYDPTIENSYRKQFCVDGREEVLDVLDTAGQEEYAAMRDSQIRSGSGFLLVYSIVQPESLREAAELRSRVMQVKDCEDYPCVLVANKCDLARERQVGREEGAETAAAWGAPFFEASAKARINVDEAFEALVRAVRAAQAAGLYDAEEGGGGGFAPVSKPKKRGVCILL